MNRSPLPLSILFLIPLLLVGTFTFGQQAMENGKIHSKLKDPDEKIIGDDAIKVQYLEIVTPLVNETCKAMAEAHGIEFGEPVVMLGNARTANLSDGGRLGVRAPMRDTETPVVRPYILVDDIEAAVKAAVKAGAEIALPPMEIPGQGTFSIYILGGIEHGLWQL